MSSDEPQVTPTEPAPPISPFMILGDADAAACEGDVCVVPDP